eukprot:TRINITY_DN560_c0_g1_i1.p1 TRINITY_DN560_c0_g1~~TRINITY_DN560_c0_g1_i1.p1  ORF type:complete len:215 (-),score=54.43 TRINITY_DN560_c0_g1_i1:50-694(-)
MGSGLRLGIVILVLLAVFGVLDLYLHQFYIFDPEVLNEIASRAIKNHENNTKLMIDSIVSDLSARYPGHINLKQNWLFNNAGGAMGALFIIHASISEYIIIFGTPIGTEGHTGRYLADDYFMILEGEQWAFSEGSLEREEWKPGQMHHLPRGEARAYRMPDKCWALEYARGWIPLMMPFGIADTLTSTLDFVTLGRTFYVYGQSVVGELLKGKI